MPSWPALRATPHPLSVFPGPENGKPCEGNLSCGEGAGYAGGITSAAMDGIKTAEEIIRRYSPLSPS
ncbi:MAG: hypothetical protein ACLR0U_20305 [Enterocloster clostridioformis]